WASRARRSSATANGCWPSSACATGSSSRATRSGAGWWSRSAEGAPVGRGGDAHRAGEVAAVGGRAGDADRRADPLDRQRRNLQQLEARADALVEQPPRRARARRAAEV